ncbi:MAG: hypothetical protein ACTHU0_21715 [Kofleriaceae bacterium]
MEMSKQHPCDGCVTCACAAEPKVDEDGLCLACGGTPVIIAEQVSVEEPHVGSDAEGEDVTRIVKMLLQRNPGRGKVRQKLATTLGLPPEDATAVHIARALLADLNPDEQGGAASFLQLITYVCRSLADAASERGNNATTARPDGHP